MVRYRDLWFWLDDRDLQSKRAFSALLLMVNLAESGQPAAAPLVTIPAVNEIFLIKRKGEKS